MDEDKMEKYSSIRDIKTNQTKNKSTAPNCRQHRTEIIACSEANFYIHIL